ncbi:MAG: hypothetical protein K9M82_00545 [Deltaproteobacteria bacterium]|nr:hypothetical protein [Deltaproteobacteria bacterium]
MTDSKPLIQDIMNEALNDPNLTNQERMQIDEIQLDAMTRARQVADHHEDRGGYTRSLEQELAKSAGEIQRIRGMAANRESRRMESY